MAKRINGRRPVQTWSLLMTGRLQIAFGKGGLVVSAENGLAIVAAVVVILVVYLL